VPRQKDRFDGRAGLIEDFLPDAFELKLFFLIKKSLV